MILANQKLTEESVERVEELCAFYNCERGEKEIFNLLLDCKLFQTITEKELVMRNYAIQRLTELGFNQEDKIRKVIKWMLDHPVLDADSKIGDK